MVHHAQRQQRTWAANAVLLFSHIFFPTHTHFLLLLLSLLIPSAVAFTSYFSTLKRIISNILNSMCPGIRIDGHSRLEKKADRRRFRLSSESYWTRANVCQSYQMLMAIANPICNIVPTKYYNHRHRRPSVISIMHDGTAKQQPPKHKIAYIWSWYFPCLMPCKLWW